MEIMMKKDGPDNNVDGRKMDKHTDSMSRNKSHYSGLSNFERQVSYIELSWSFKVEPFLTAIE